MYKKIPLFIGIIAVSIASCNSNTTNSSNKAVDSTSASHDAAKGAPVETKEANTRYPPAFAGQTRIAGIKTTTPYSVRMLTDGLEKPWGITVLPDGRLLITQKTGTLRIADTSGKLSAPITGLPPVNTEEQGGLLGITLDPAFTTNRMVYWTFSQNTADGTLTAVAKGKLAADEKTIRNATVIYQATPAHKGTKHYGGRILFDKTGNLFVSTGERSDLETRPQAQFLNSALGKVLRITTEGKPAPGNPFAGKPDVRPEIYSYGHRNVQNLAFNPETGDLWEAEFGPRGGDELNLIQPGKNYGWPTITYGIEYDGPKIGEGIQQKEGMEQPVYYWDPVLSPSGMTFYTGNNIPEWKGNLFIPGLSSSHIARLVIKNNKVVGEENLLADQFQRFRAIITGNDGALYTVTDDGRLYKIDKK